MKCPRCGVENGVKFDDMIYIIDRLKGVVCAACGRYSGGLAWRWGPGWFDPPSAVERFRRILEMAKRDE